MKIHYLMTGNFHKDPIKYSNTYSETNFQK